MYCANCGKRLNADQKFCAKCGAKVNATSAPQSLNAESTSTPRGIPYAGFWRRFVGWVIDYFIAALAIAVIANLLIIPLSGQNAPPRYLAVVYFLLPMLYVVLMESSSLQATLGKLVVGIKVTDLSGNRISLARALGRFIAHILDGLTLGIGYGMAAFTERRQALHDKVADTLVVRRAFNADSIRAGGLAPTSAARTALVVIAMVFFGPFGIGVLAAIAIPAYQDYTIRAQVSEAFNAAVPLQSAVAEAASQGRNWADINSESLGLGQPNNLRYVQSMRVDAGAVVIEFGRAAPANIRGLRVVLAPGLTSAHDIVWICGHAKVPGDVSMPIDNAAQYTTIADRYLPLACRP